MSTACQTLGSGGSRCRITPKQQNSIESGFSPSIACHFSSLLNSKNRMNCRPGCGACCIAPSISSAIPGMPGGKPAGVRCVQLDAANNCLIFGQPERPAVCGQLRPSAEMCGGSAPAALAWLMQLERATSPS
jgi:hypothetical protein